LYVQKNAAISSMFNETQPAWLLTIDTRKFAKRCSPFAFAS